MIYPPYLAYAVPMMLGLARAITSPTPVPPAFSLPSTNLVLENLTANFTHSEAINYHVNGSVTSLEIAFGAPLPAKAMGTTLVGCRSSIARAIYWGGDGYQSITPDPYVFPDEDGEDPRDRRSRGAEIEVRSTGAEKLGGLTWWQLNAVVKGLQEAMFDKGIYSEAHFKIFDGLTKVPEQGVGRLTTVRRRPTLVDANVTWL